MFQVTIISVSGKPAILLCADSENVSEETINSRMIGFFMMIALIILTKVAFLEKKNRLMDGRVKKQNMFYFLYFCPFVN